MLTESQKQRAIDYFKELQQHLVDSFTQVDGKAKGEYKTWDRESSENSTLKGGGGTMWSIRGDVVEKAGANFSIVSGDKYPAIEGEYAGKPFFAAGVSTICHMMNPKAPIGHMNVRLLVVGNDFWFGGGADLTPMFVFEEDKQEFHQKFKDACTLYAPDAYDRFSAWCDEYFFIKHRNSVRGVGGVFFDYLKNDFARTFEFIKAVGTGYAEVFTKILNKRKDMIYTSEDKIAQEYWRGRYVEFNLLYDRGTRFGLMTGGNTDAIFVSLPPRVRW